MSYGFEAKNDYSQVLFSDKSYTLEYIGKATLRTDIGYKGWTGYTPTSGYRYFDTYGTRYDFPWYLLGYYEIEAQSQDMVAFCQIAPNDIFTGIVYQHQQTATTTRFYVISQGLTNINNDPNAPTIYCFRKIQPKASDGYGMQIYDAYGNLTFSTKSNMMVEKAGAVVAVQYSNFAASSTGSLPYASNNGGTNALNIKNHSFINTPISMTKPALSFYPTATGVFTSGTPFHLLDCGARYNSSLNVIQTQYGRVGSVFPVYRPPNRQIPEHNTFVMMIDGADYD